MQLEHSRAAASSAALADPEPCAILEAAAVDVSRVLIVDDNEINRRVLAGMLRKERYTLFSAANGEQARAMAQAERPDLILLDIMMPGRNGYQPADRTT